MELSIFPLSEFAVEACPLNFFILPLFSNKRCMQEVIKGQGLFRIQILDVSLIRGQRLMEEIWYYLFLSQV